MQLWGNTLRAREGSTTLKESGTKFQMHILATYSYGPEIKIERKGP